MSPDGESCHALLLIHRDPESQDCSPGVGPISASFVCCPLVPAVKLRTPISDCTQLQALKRGGGGVAAWRKAEALEVLILVLPPKGAWLSLSGPSISFSPCRLAGGP